MSCNMSDEGMRTLGVTTVWKVYEVYMKGLPFLSKMFNVRVRISTLERNFTEGGIFSTKTNKTTGIEPKYKFI